MIRLIAVLPLFSASAAWAHPGDHSHTGLPHFLTEPDHLAILAVAAIAVGVALRVWKRK